MGLVVIALVSLYVLSIEPVAHALVNGLETVPVLTEPDLVRQQPQAIVVLGGGRYSDAPEYGGDTVARGTLERLRYGARLHRQTGLPLLVTGGRVYGETTAEATLMKSVLTDEFGVGVKWAENESRNTFENAR
ncbi:MAG: YdcF family protein, partial [Gammaproteobacteria bacterium]